MRPAITARDPFAPGLLARLPALPDKVALLRASRIGDFLCATPAFRALRRALPRAEITLIGLPFVQPLVDRNPDLDRFAAFPGWPGIAEQFFAPGRARRFLEAMRAARFDLAIQMHGSGVFANPFARLLGARLTAGFVRPQDPAAPLDAALPLPDGHEIDRLLALATFLGAPGSGKALSFPLLPDDTVAADRLLAGLPPPWIGLHPDARAGSKRWPEARFLTAGEALRARHGGTLLILGDRQEAAPLTGDGVRDLRGATPLPVLGAVIARLAVLLTNDSGPAHLAYALGTPSVTVFGGTDPARWGPPDTPRHRVVVREIGCRPCDFDPCPIGAPCLSDIPSKVVVVAAEAALDAGRSQ